jgi:hypothetical protein
MEVSDQVSDLAVLSQEKEPTVPIGEEAGWASRADLNALKKSSSTRKEYITKSLVTKPIGLFTIPAQTIQKDFKSLTSAKL